MNFIYYNTFARITIFIILALAMYILVSSHSNLYTQFVVGYSAVIIMFIVFKIKNISESFSLFVKFMGIVIVLRYLYWRTFDTLVYEGFLDFSAALLLYFAEVLAITIYLLGIFSSLNLLKREPVVLDNYPESEWPTVDILIPTYNEPHTLVENTILAALAMDYPKEKFNVYLLDDGGTVQKCNDPDIQKSTLAKKRQKTLQKFCELCGATYLTREKNEHSKAGNLNAAMDKIDSELLLVLDADHIPSKQFLQKTVGLFLKDEKIFLVQTPHAFYNIDPIEKNLKMGNTVVNESDMFYKHIQLGHDFWESSFFCGSAAVLRRKHLDEVGGIGLETITEDAETAIKLHNKGYKSAYISEPMIRGLQAETFTDLVLQRIRWTQGMIQIFLFHNPLSSKNLKWYQKLSYFSAILFWLFAFSRVVFYIAPLLYLFFGLHIYNANGIEIFAYVIPHIAMAVMMSYFLYAKVRSPFFSELYETVLAFFTLPAIVSVLANPKKPTFNVTPKGQASAANHISDFSTPFLVMLILVILGFVASFYRFYAYPDELDSIIITTVWNLFNMLMLIAAIGVISEKQEFRKYIRLPLETNSEIMLDNNMTIEGIITDISETSVNISPHKIDGNHEISLRVSPHVSIEIKDIDGKPFTVRSTYMKSFGFGKQMVFNFDDLSTEIETRQKLILLIYGNSTKWNQLEDDKPVMAPLHSFAFIISHGFKNAMFIEAFKFTFLKMISPFYKGHK